MKLKLRFIFLVVCFTTILTSVVKGKPSTTDDITQGKSEIVDILRDRPLEAYQNKLLELAFESATAIPIKPHIKDRSRAQEKVVAAALDLDQPKLAFKYIEQIDNWRRGIGFADLAFYYAKHGYAEKVDEYLILANQVSETADGWRRDQIRVKIAKTYTLLEQKLQADKFEANIVDSELGKVAVVKAMIAKDNFFNEQVKSLDDLIETGNFDILINALNAYTELFNRFYKNVERRLLVEDKIKTSWGNLPLFLRIELLTRLINFAIDHSDQTKALANVNEAQTLTDSAKFPLEYQIKLMAKLIKLRFLAGDKQKAKNDANALLSLFNSKKDKIVNIYRAKTLCPLAEAYQSMGNKGSSLKVYKMAVEESVENANSRPRAEDLTTICISMALNRVEPNAELWNRIYQIKKQFGHPW